MTDKIMKIAAIIFFASFTLGFVTGTITEYSLSEDMYEVESYEVERE